jgi:hypothetical protein
MKLSSGVISGALFLALAAAGCAGKTAAVPVGVVVPEPASGQIVTAAISVHPDILRPGQEFVVSVGVRIAPGYHIQGPGPAKGPFQPTAIELEIPDGSVAVGDWKQPAPGVTRSGEFIYTDSVIFERRCRASLNAGTEPLSIAATLRFQACNDEVCRPPATLNLVARVRIAEKSTR